MTGTTSGVDFTVDIMGQFFNEIIRRLLTNLVPLKMCFISVVCEADELAEICDLDPCQHATCPSHPEAVCVSHTCGRCRPKFFVESEEVECGGKGPYRWF